MTFNYLQISTCKVNGVLDHRRVPFNYLQISTLPYESSNKSIKVFLFQLSLDFNTVLVSGDTYHVRDVLFQLSLDFNPCPSLLSVESMLWGAFNYLQISTHIAATMDKNGTTLPFQLSLDFNKFVQLIDQMLKGLFQLSLDFNCMDSAKLPGIIVPMAFNYLQISTELAHPPQGPMRPLELSTISRFQRAIGTLRRCSSGELSTISRFQRTTQWVGEPSTRSS